MGQGPPHFRDAFLGLWLRNGVFCPSAGRHVIPLSHLHFIGLLSKNVEGLGQWRPYNGQGHTALLVHFSGGCCGQVFSGLDLAFGQVPMAESVDAQQGALCVGQQPSGSKNVCRVAVEG